MHWFHPRWPPPPREGPEAQNGNEVLARPVFNACGHPNNRRCHDGRRCIGAAVNGSAPDSASAPDSGCGCALGGCGHSETKSSGPYLLSVAPVVTIAEYQAGTPSSTSVSSAMNTPCSLPSILAILRSRIWSSVPAIIVTIIVHLL